MDPFAPKVYLMILNRLSLVRVPLWRVIINKPLGKDILWDELVMSLLLGVVLLVRMSGIRLLLQVVENGGLGRGVGSVRQLGAICFLQGIKVVLRYDVQRKVIDDRLLLFRIVGISELLEAKKGILKFLICRVGLNGNSISSLD